MVIEENPFVWMLFTFGVAVEAGAVGHDRCRINFEEFKVHCDNIQFIHLFCFDGAASSALFRPVEGYIGDILSIEFVRLLNAGIINKVQGAHDRRETQQDTLKCFSIDQVYGGLLVAMVERICCVHGANLSLSACY